MEEVIGGAGPPSGYRWKSFTVAPEPIFIELLSNLVEIPFQANCRSVRRSRHPVDLAML